MKIYGTYILSLLLASVYLLSSFGIDVHTCSATGSVQIVLPYGVPDCEHDDDLHKCAKDEGINGKCEHMHHTAKCCHNELYALSDDYTDSRIQIDSGNKFQCSVIPVMVLNYNSQADSLDTGAFVDSIGEAPPLLANGYNKTLNVWRL